MANDELCRLSAAELRHRYSRRELSPVDVTEAVLARIERLNPSLGAFCTLVPEAALAEARQAEAAIQRSEPQGLLHGVPVSIKDLLPTRGIRTTRGSLLYADWVPEFEPPVVQRLRDAGAIVLGKTNTPEFGWKGVSSNRLFPPTRNPWSLERTAGGSSGGAGAAVAAGLGPIAQGSDGAGSIRIPSAFCGIFGHKPSFGLVPQVPTGATETLSHIGPMTRTVRDAALMLDVIVGPDDRDRNTIPRSVPSYTAPLETGIRGLRVAWSPDLGYARCDPEPRELAEAAARRFAELGCEVEEASPGLEDPYPILEPIYVGGQAGALHGRFAEVRDQLDPGLATMIENGQHLTAGDFVAAMLARAGLWERLHGFMQRYDLLLTPAVAVTAFPHGRDWADTVGGEATEHFVAWTPYTYPFNLTGQPAATVPCGFSSDGLPVGLQIVGRRWADVTVLQAARAFEQLQPWGERWPDEAAS
jgi:aspartyl-tRNA(Asn)/glutamyl-tRNA(Gln) amidotransferase subunit A